MLGRYAGIRRCDRALYAHIPSRALSPTTATLRIAEKKPSSRLAAWLRRNTSSIAVYPDRNLLKKELQYLGDPLKLADNTLHLLQQPGQHGKAGEMVKMASKSMQCTVSWNHMIDFYMNHKRPLLAMSTYHDVSTQPCTLCQASPLTRSR